MDVRAAHHQDTGVLLDPSQGALHEARDCPVFHRNVASRTYQIGLLETAFGHRRVVAFEAQDGPYQFGTVNTARLKVANCDGIQMLLEDETGEYGENLHHDAVAEFIDALDYRRLL